VRFALGLLGLVGAMFAGLVLFNDVPFDDPLWWLTNDSNPHISINGPSGIVRGPIEASINVERTTRVRIDAIRLDDQLKGVPESGRIAIDTATLPDGQHRIDVLAHDTSRRQNTASATWTFASDNTPPRLDVVLDPIEGPQEGRTSVLRIRFDEPTRDVQASIADRRLTLQQDVDGSYWALQGVSPGATDTHLNVRVSGADALGNAAQWQHDWQVRHTAFDEDDLDLAPSAEDLRAHAAEDAQLNQIYQRPNGAKRWDGLFRLPVDGEVTTQFGTHRSYEFHPGIDFAAAAGTVVSAPAAGVVVFTGEVPARGNVLILDHGAAVYSTYAHLQRFEVQAGDEVKAGEPIARVGTTGFSTGPHLHWEMWVDRANVDPQEWTHRAFP
jgi:murein DD-endopeptidase MepM/ murein hydrolase activator NlpD